ncbi:MAG: MBL fold metallo-hydrolase [Clostridia bacterium]|nr:MBL fold metallo-hydrolase [Clostridia bacterium]
MYELVQVSKNCYYIQCPAKIGIVKINDDEVCLIDSGNDKDAGKKALKIINENGWSLRAIYNTHSHADHIGGNALIQERTGCTIYAKGIDRDFTNHPSLEGALIWGGYPYKDLKHKFLLAQPSVASELCEESLPEGIEIIDLKGHTPDMVGFRTSDDIVYLADCLSSKETLEKYQIGFIYDIGEYLKTLEMVKGLKARLFIPAHAPACEDISSLAQYNIDKVNEVAELIIQLCADGTTFESLLKALFDHYSLTMTHEQYVLVGSTVRSYLAYLKDEGKLTVRFDENLMLWERA